MHSAFLIPAPVVAPPSTKWPATLFSPCQWHYQLHLLLHPLVFSARWLLAKSSNEHTSRSWSAVTPKSPCLCCRRTGASDTCAEGAASSRELGHQIHAGGAHKSIPQLPWSRSRPTPPHRGSRNKCAASSAHLPFAANACCGSNHRRSASLTPFPLTAPAQDAVCTEMARAFDGGTAASQHARRRHVCQVRKRTGVCRCQLLARMIPVQLGARAVQYYTVITPRS
jgi:hypothetical protein